MGFWINVYEDVIDHPKTRQMMKLSGLSDDEIIGKLIKLWTWGIKNADPSGFIMYADKQDIADVILSKPYSANKVEPIRVVECMIETGWIDMKGDALYLHDWDYWQGHFYRAEEKRKKNMERQRKFRETHSEDVLPSASGFPQQTITSLTEHPDDPGLFKPDIKESNEQPNKKTTKRKETVKAEDAKTKYGEFVSMTDDEYKKLIEAVGEPATKKAVEILDNYKGSSGKKYKSDYRAIRMWVLDSIKEKYPNLILAKQTWQQVDRQSNPYPQEWSEIKRGED